MFIPSYASDKTINIQQSFLPLVILQPSIQIDYKFRKRTSARLIFEYSYILAPQVGPGFSAGLKLNYMLADLDIMGNSGYYIDPYFKYHKNNILKVGHNAGLLEIGTLLGYQRMWNNGFNIKLAVGAAAHSKKITTILLYNITEKEFYVLPIAQLTFGYAFG